MSSKIKINPATDPAAASRKLADTIDRLHRRGAVRPLKRILARLHPADLAAVLAVLPDAHLIPVFDAIPDTELAGEVLVELAERVRDRLFEEKPIEDLVPILEQLPPDELTDLIQELDPDLAQRLMALLERDSKEEVEDLLQYTPDTAGGIMTPDFFSLTDDVSVESAIGKVRQHYDVEIIFYLYVTDAAKHLTGVVSLRQLLLADPQQPLREIMNSRVVSVHTDTPQEEVADRVDKYQLLAIPVVDDDNVLVGMVTVDDVIEAIEEITTKNMLRMAGTDESETLTESALRIAVIRLPWLLVSFAGYLLISGIMDQFESVLVQLVALSAFLPAVTGMAGNIGVQASTVAVRSLATGALDLEGAVTEFFKELRVGLLLGLFYGLVLGGFGWFLFGNLQLAEIVSLTILVNMSGAAVLAITMPLVFERVGVDPAIATGPFVTTGIDVLGILSYMLIASLVMGLI